VLPEFDVEDVVAVIGDLRTLAIDTISVCAGSHHVGDRQLAVEAMLDTEIKKWVFASE